jgi:hypothetical protein
LWLVGRVANPQPAAPPGPRSPAVRGVPLRPPAPAACLAVAVVLIGLSAISYQISGALFFAPQTTGDHRHRPQSTETESTDDRPQTERLRTQDPRPRKKNQNPPPLPFESWQCHMPPREISRGAGVACQPVCACACARCGLWGMSGSVVLDAAVLCAAWRMAGVCGGTQCTDVSCKCVCVRQAYELAIYPSVAALATTCRLHSGSCLHSGQLLDLRSQHLKQVSWK